MRLLGAGLPISLGVEDLKDTWKKDEPSFESSSAKDDEVEQYKKEIDELKDEIKGLKEA